jgi:uncharacterized glyoxalase superfamily protein PhnB
MPWMSPYLIVQDVDEALSFYECAFGFHRGETMTNDQGTTVHAAMHYYDQLIMMGKEGADSGDMRPPQATGTPSPMFLFFYVQDVDEAYQRALDAGAEACQPPADQFWGDRMATVQDPDGYRWALATNIEAITHTGEATGTS